MTKKQQLLHARRRLVSRNYEIDSCERSLRMAVVKRVKDIHELRILCSHQHIVEFRDSGCCDSGNWEHRDRFCLDCGDYEHQSDLSRPPWSFVCLRQEPNYEVEKKHLSLFKKQLHEEGRLEVAQAVVTKK